MKILNEYVVGTTMLLIGGAFFSPRFADILVYPLGTVPSALPLIGGEKVTVGRVLGIIPLSIGISVLAGKIFSTSVPVIKDIADSSLSSMSEGAIEGAFGAEDGEAHDYTPESYDPLSESPTDYDPATESHSAETEESMELMERDADKTRAKKSSRTVKAGISTDTSKPKGKFKPWQSKGKVTKKAEGSMTWMEAVSAAKKEMDITGFHAIKKGTPLYDRAKEIYGK